MSGAQGESFNLDDRRRELLQARRRQQGLAAPRADRIPRHPGRATYPLSFNQQRLWFLDQLQPGSAAYILFLPVGVHGPLSVPVLTASLAEVVRRHDALRTTFEHPSAGRERAESIEPVQRIAPPQQDPHRLPWLPLIDGSGLPAARRERWMRELTGREARRPFDLARGPLLRGILMRLAPAEHLVLLTMHHIVSDGWSMGLLLGEMAQLYAALRLRRPSPLPELALQYGDYALWQRQWLQGEVLERQLAYWRQQLGGAPIVELPADRPRPPAQSFRGASTRLVVAPDLGRAAAALARKSVMSLYMVLLAAFDVLIWRYSGQSDVVVGTPTANRPRRELEGLIGFFANTLVLRTGLGGDPSFAELAARVRDTTLGAHAHQDLPFQQLVEELKPRRDLARNPLFQLMFNLINTPMVTNRQTADLTFSTLEEVGSASMVDLQVYLVEKSGLPEEEGGIQSVWVYSTDLFDRATVMRLASHFAVLTAAAVARPGARISELPLLAEEERWQLLAEWNATGRPQRPATVGEAIAARAALRPHAVALACDGHSLSYRELDRLAARWAVVLRSLGVGPESLVAVAMERSLEMVVSLLAIWKAGGAYLPIDPDYPGERRALMLEDSGAALVLTQERLLSEPVEPRPATGSGPPARAASARWFAVDGRDWLNSVDSLDSPAVDGELGASLAGVRVSPENAAYVLYTSGSTGRPKGVVVPHGALANFLAAMAARPGLGEDDVLVAVTSLSFDIAGLEIYLPLLAGARVELASREVAGDGARLRQLLERSGATVMQATPATWRLLIEAGWSGGERPLRVLCGGEALPEALAAQLLARSDAVWNLYGPTETTVWSTRVELADGAPVTIGRPIDNTEVYVLDAAGQPAPVGVPGELLLGGAGVARGYLRRPELTAERFVPDPFGAAGSRLYRTGDLARLLPDGRLACLGRLDHQVKVRGFRIELGEIEGALGRHPAVGAAVVAARGDQLVAYWVARQPGPESPVIPELRAFLRAILPDYMIPATCVRLAALPLTPNGKVDRQALAILDSSRSVPESAAGGEGPRGPLEELLAGIWMELLGSERLAAHDDFFELGGHSLTATQLIARIRQALGVELPLRELFATPTVAGLAVAIERLRLRQAGPAESVVSAESIDSVESVETVPPLSGAARAGRRIPLSFGQQRLWFLDRLDPGSAAYNLPFAVRASGPLERAALAAALSEIARRHEVLRTTFAAGDGELAQVIHPAGPLALPLVDLDGLPEERREPLARRLAEQEAARPFDLERGPLLRLRLLRLSASEHLALLTLHHSVADGWSMGILVRELVALYDAARRRAASPLSELPLQYADFACWQRDWLRGAALARQLAFWRRRLAGAPALLELPTDRPRPAVQRFRGGRLAVALAPAATAGLRALARREGATLFMVLLAAWNALLARHSGQRDLVVGSPIAGRRQLETEGLIGLFLNTLALRTDAAGDPPFAELLARVREVALDAYAHQDLPFEKLVDELELARDLSRTPVFQVLLALQNLPPQLLTAAELGGLTLLPMPLAGFTSKFDLSVNLTDAGGALAGGWMFNTDLFDPPTMVRLRTHFENLLAGVAADPGQPLSAVPLLDAAERQQLVEWNATAADYERQLCLHELLERQAARTPAAPAVLCEGAALSYGELDASAGRLAAALRRLGVGPEVRVGVCAERSLEMVVGLLGVLKAGGAYVPLDPGYPPERLAFMLDDSRRAPSIPTPIPTSAPVLLTLRRLLERLPEEAVAGVPAWRVVLLDEPESWPEGAPGGADGGARAVPENLAYVIYTSGSTGRPKGAMNSHRGVVNRLLWMQAAYGLTAADRVLQKTPFSFDVSVWEFFWPLLAGAALVVARPGGHLDSAYLVQVIAEQGVTTLHFVPSMLQVFVEAPGVERCGALRRVFASGEALPAELVRRYYQRLRAPLWNLYGPTEAAVDVTAWACEPLLSEPPPLSPGPQAAAAAPRSPLPQIIPIGRPVANTAIHLLDASLQPVPLGVPGELYIGGCQVGRGYLNRPELTAERFVPDPFAAAAGWGAGSRLYRTGDLARYLPDGAVEFLGRTDHQVKVRGFRIELGEIEAALQSSPGVREAVVAALAPPAGAAAGGPQLAAYVVPRQGQERGAPLELAALRAHLARILPEYMLPTALVVLDAMPLNPSGKVDRRALPAPAPETAAAAAARAAPGGAAPRSDLERFIAGLWQELLGLDRVFARENFFALGGNSISGAVLINRLQQELGEIVHVVVIFDAPTVAELAAYFGREHPAAVARRFGPQALAGALPADGPRVAPASPGAGTAEQAAEPVGEAEVALLRRLVRPLPRRAAEAARNPPAAFVLSPPRSGSTLLRVMLGGHPALFAPPELELLGFNTMAQRRAAFSGRDSFWLEGAIRAVMEARRCAAGEAAALVEECEREEWDTARFYARLQDWIGARMLVDKTPSYAFDTAVLRRAEELFSEPFYLHLVRQPLGMIHSFEEAKLDQLFFRAPHPFSRRQLAELIWIVSHRNIVELLAAVPAARQHRVHFEELVAEPERVLRGICAALGIDYHPDMALPYKEKSARMTDGLHAESRMLGDVKFHQHRRVDPAAAGRWRERYGEDFLGEITRGLAARLGAAPLALISPTSPTSQRPAALPPIPAISLREIAAGAPLPLSYAQERLWVLDQLHPGSAAYNIPAAIRLRGRLAAAALRRGLSEIVRRHAVLRSSFRLAADRQPAAFIAPAAELPLPQVDLEALPAAARERELRRLAALDAARPFALRRGPLLRATLLRLSAAEHVVLFNMHHIASDGWSMGVLLREVAALYAAFAQGRPSPLPVLPIQYPDFARWQRGWLAGALLAEQLAYWERTLAGTPPLQLPTDRPRPPLETFRGRSRGFVLPGAAGVAAGLRELGLRQGATLFMTLLAAFGALLARTSGQSEVAIGSPTANRTRAELEGLIGFFVNTLVLRVDGAGEPSFVELLARVRRAVLGAFAHQEVPFEKVVAELQPERDLSRSPLFQVMFILQNAPAEEPALPGLTLEPMPISSGVAKFDLTLAMTGGPGWLAGTLEYNVDLFDGATIARLLGHFESLLTALAADPASCLAEIPLLSAPERHQLLVEWSDTRRPGWLEAWEAADGARPPGRVDEAILAVAARRPEAVAVIGSGGDGLQLCYREVAADSARLARSLVELDLRPGEAVAVALGRSLQLVPALLGVWRAGGAYVPMDPAYPPERLRLMFEDAGCRLLLADAATPPELLRRAPVVVWFGAPGATEPAPEAQQLVVSASIAAGVRDNGSAPGIAQSKGSPDSLAYIIFTSGSTGRPKGVEVTHRSLLNFLAAMAERPGLAPDDLLLAVTSLSFDIAALELYLPLLVGARLELVSREVAVDGPRLLERLRASGATVLQATPATWRMLIDAGWDGGTGRLKALCGGEALPDQLARQLCARAAEVWNLYGPTETTVWSAAGRVDAGAEEASGPPIGPPIANTSLVLLGTALEPVPVGVRGELYIGGEGVARGYRGRPELTAERFVPDPYSAAAGARLYRTGDLARFRVDGRMEFLGRFDHQVKVRGFRIELGEVEAALEALPEVAQAVVVMDGGLSPVGSRPALEGLEVGRLVAYVVPRARHDGSVEAIAAEGARARLARTLPDFMIPSLWVVLDALPLTPNGKVDRRALPAPQGARLARAPYMAPRGALEELVASIWAEVVGVERVGVHDNFFTLGGHSLLATQAVARIGEALGAEVAVRSLFEAPTVSGLAGTLRRTAGDGVDLEAAARLALELFRLSDDEVKTLLADRPSGVPGEVA